jgi:endonuclease-3
MVMHSNSAARSRRAADLWRVLERLYPEAECALHHRSPFELLVATILSAQCTDERVNAVTPALFERYPTPQTMAAAPLAALESLVRPTGFFRNKARAIKGAAGLIVRDHGGEVPRTMEELVSLPGVARKTANVVLGTAFGLSEGIAVDTHVGRLARRLGLSESQDPVGVEKDLMRQFPREHWTDLSHRLILHGRRVCAARRPACERCGVADLCPKKGL